MENEAINNSTDQAKADQEPDKETIEKWKRESPNGEVYRLEYKGGIYYFVTPSRPTMKRFIDKARKSLYDAMMIPLVDCLRFPDLKTLSERIERMPQLPSALFTPFSEKVGLDDEAIVKNV